MRLLLVTSALASHHFAMVPFAWSAVARGHDVRVATSPDLAPIVAESGLPVVAVGPAADFEARHRELLARVERGEVRYDPKIVFALVADAMADELVELARAWRPDAVVWDPAALAGPLAAVECGALSVRHLWGSDIMGRGRTLAERLPAEFHALYERFGHTVPEDPLWWTIDPCPASITSVADRNRLPVRYVPYSPNGVLPDWLFAPTGRPRVCLTFGAGIAMREFVAGSRLTESPLLRTLSELDVEVVLAVAAADRPLLGEVPDFVRVVSSCPLPALLPTCRAIVHHGGDGTLFTAALAGVPQLAVPYLPDAKFGSARFAQTGAVRTIEPAEVAGRIARSHVEDLLSDECYRRAATDLAAQMRAQPVADVVVRQLGDLVGTGMVSR